MLVRPSLTTPCSWTGTGCAASLLTKTDAMGAAAFAIGSRSTVAPSTVLPSRSRNAGMNALRIFPPSCEEAPPAAHRVITAEQALDDLQLFHRRDQQVKAATSGGRASNRRSPSRAQGALVNTRSRSF